MPCFHPRAAYQPRDGGRIKFSAKPKDNVIPISVPCSQCIGCRMDRSQDWATRIVHESQLHDQSWFVTLTFANEHLPWDGSISVRDVQLFMKRLRKQVGAKVRFFACGEYGGKTGRPHYHLILFGLHLSELIPWRPNHLGQLLYRSPLLEKVWPFGHVEVGSVTVQSAAYVARYALKKVTGKQAEDHYSRVNPQTGEVTQLRPEFICMSTKPGLGLKWFEQFERDAFPSDFVIIDGAKRPVPRYYAKKLAAKDDDAIQAIKLTRTERAKRHADNNTPERLGVREEVTTLRAQRLKRGYEEDQ